MAAHSWSESASAATSSPSAAPEGLSTAEARRRLAQFGPNELPRSRHHQLLVLASEIIREPMLFLLVATGAIYFFIGDRQEAITLSAAVFLIIGITFYQRRKTERALESLRALSAPRALVIRDGERRRVPGREVVPGDIVLLLEGDRIPADGAVLSAINLEVDESLLTGESIPVSKSAASKTSPIAIQPGGAGLAVVFSGTLVVRGSGVARITATGPKSELGTIGIALGNLDSQPTRVQQETARLVRIFATFGIALCVAVAVLYALRRASWTEGALAGLTVAISMLPEEIPVVLTVFLAMGAWRISKQHVLTRRMPAIEALGSATVLCVDKTGTLTQNAMAVAEIATTEAAPQAAAGQISSAMTRVLRYAVLSSQERAVDPMETALLDAWSRNPSSAAAADLAFEREYPLASELLVITRAWRDVRTGRFVIATKGAPETVAQLCKLSDDEVRQMNRQLAAMSARGQRVIAVAEGQWDRAELPASPLGFEFRYLGLVGLADPLRPTVPAAVQECEAAGVRVVMVTGDYPGTATTIAQQAGLRNCEAVVTGPQINAMTDEQLQDCVRQTNVFARVRPEQKLRIVRALKSNGEIVAMTGDGVNDAPALKTADIGVAMGERGSDVAREAAALVLLADDFSFIVTAIRSGRRVYDNLKKALEFVLAVHVPIGGLAFLPVLFGWPVILMPVHIVFLELIIDPACSIAFEAEPEEPDVMRRPPRAPDAPLLSAKEILASLLQGAGVLLAVLALFGVLLSRNAGEVLARSVAFAALVLANLLLIWMNRSWKLVIARTLRFRNPALWLVTAGALLVLMAAFYVAPIRALFRFAPLAPQHIMLAAVTAAASISWFELLKWLHRRSARRPA